MVVGGLAGPERHRRNRDVAAAMTSRGPAEVSDYVSQVLDVAESIPPGRVMSYGDVAEFVGAGGPRQVGRVMSLWGGSVPWWRVVRADGRPLAGHEAQALERYRAEGTPLRPGGPPSRLDMRRARWVPTAP